MGIVIYWWTDRYLSVFRGFCLAIFKYAAAPRGEYILKCLKVLKWYGKVVFFFTFYPVSSP